MLLFLRLTDGDPSSFAEDIVFEVVDLPDGSVESENVLHIFILILRINGLYFASGLLHHLLHSLLICP